MANTLSVLQHLINKEGVRHWADVNGYTVTENNDSYIVDGYTVSFDEEGSVTDVRKQVITGNRV